tara:strand:- start:37 stop:717 length:681 start_codon:yes stop_codon:yes gene_type:complete
MALRKCKECGHQVAKSAKACPSCGAKQPQGMGIVGWLVFIFIFLPILFSVIGQVMDGGSSPRPASSSPPKANDVPPKPVQESAAPDNWIKGEYKDQMTDEVTFTYRAFSENTARFEFPYSQPGGSTLSLVFRKKGDFFDAYLKIDKGQMMCGIRECEFSLRISDGKVQGWTGLPPSSHDSEIMFVRDARQLESIVRKGEPIRIGINFYQYGTIAFHFDTEGYNPPW